MAQVMSEYWQALSHTPLQLTTTRQQIYVAIATSAIITGAFLTWKASRQSQKLPLREPHPKHLCRFDLTTTKSAKLTLPDGRELGYAEYGSPTGSPVVFLHGAPGSRLEGAHLDKPAQDLDIRIISVDRPGIGWSSSKPNRKLLDHADDVHQLTTYLGLNEYSVLGVSGGGPYAFACAYALPADKLKRVSVVVGMGMPDMSKRGMGWWNWLGFAVGFRYRLPGVKLIMSQDPATQVHLPEEERFMRFRAGVKKDCTHPKEVELTKDAEYFDDSMRLASASLREAFSEGMDGWILDAQLMANDWGFRLEDVRPDLEIQLWYGKHDVNCPMGYGKETALRLKGDRVQLRVEDETHLSLFVNWKEEFLRQLVQGSAPA